MAGTSMIVERTLKAGNVGDLLFWLDELEGTNESVTVLVDAFRYARAELEYNDEVTVTFHIRKI